MGQWDSLVDKVLTAKTGDPSLLQELTWVGEEN